MCVLTMPALGHSWKQAFKIATIRQQFIAASRRGIRQPVVWRSHGPAVPYRRTLCIVCIRPVAVPARVTSCCADKLYRDDGTCRPAQSL